MQVDETGNQGPWVISEDIEMGPVSGKRKVTVSIDLAKARQSTAEKGLLDLLSTQSGYASFKVSSVATIFRLACFFHNR